MVGRYFWGTNFHGGQLFIGGHIAIMGRSLLGDTLLLWADFYFGALLRWAYVYWVTHCYGGQIFIGGLIVMKGQIFISGPIVMMGRYFWGHIVTVGSYLLRDTLL